MRSQVAVGGFVVIRALLSFLRRIGMFTVTVPIVRTGYSKPPMSNPWTYFKEDEVKGLETEFVAKLEKARHVAGVPFIITSGKRDKIQNETAGGVSNSTHMEGKAVDLRSHSSRTHFLIVKGAIEAGIRRIGVYHDSEGRPSHCHLDDSATLEQDVLWIGESH